MKRSYRISGLAFLLGLVLASAVSARAEGMAACDQDATYPLISKAELQKAVAEKKAFVVDVNSAESFKDTHVPGAIHYGSQRKDFVKMLPADKSAMIVAYCGGPACGAWKKAAESACKRGYTNVKHFKEGISGWVKNG